MKQNLFWGEEIVREFLLIFVLKNQVSFFIIIMKKLNQLKPKHNYYALVLVVNNLQTALVCPYYM